MAAANDAGGLQALDDGRIAGNQLDALREQMWKQHESIVPLLRQLLAMDRRANVHRGYFPGLSPTADDKCPISICGKDMLTVTSQTAHKDAGPLEHRRKACWHIYDCAAGQALTEGLDDLIDTFRPKADGMAEHGLFCPIHGIWHSHITAPVRAYEHIRDALQKERSEWITCKSDCGKVIKAEVKAVAHHSATEHKVWLCPGTKVAADAPLGKGHFLGAKIPFDLDINQFVVNAYDWEQSRGAKLAVIQQEWASLRGPYNRAENIAWSGYEAIEPNCGYDDTCIPIESVSGMSVLQWGICPNCIHDDRLPASERLKQYTPKELQVHIDHDVERRYILARDQAERSHPEILALATAASSEEPSQDPVYPDEAYGRQSCERPVCIESNDGQNLCLYECLNHKVTKHRMLMRRIGNSKTVANAHPSKHLFASSAEMVAHIFKYGPTSISRKAAYSRGKAKDRVADPGSPPPIRKKRRTLESNASGKRRANKSRDQAQASPSAGDSSC